MVFIFDRFLCQRRFLQGLQWVLMGVSVCSARFFVGSGGFLLWFLQKSNTPTLMKFSLHLQYCYHSPKRDLHLLWYDTPVADQDVFSVSWCRWSPPGDNQQTQVSRFKLKESDRITSNNLKICELNEYSTANTNCKINPSDNSNIYKRPVKSNLSLCLNAFYQC